MRAEHINQRCWFPITPAIIVSSLVLLFGLYVGSYLLLVTPPGKPGLFGPHARYRAGEPFTPLFFFPLEQIDRRVRPNSWILPRKE